MISTTFNHYKLAVLAHTFNNNAVIVARFTLFHQVNELGRTVYQIIFAYSPTASIELLRIPCLFSFVFV